MTAHALISGALFRAPEQKTSKAGKPYVSATIRAKDGDASTFWRVTVFSESAQEEIMRLRDGDAVSAQGTMKAELYRPEGGEPRLSLSIIADQVLALKPARKSERKAEPVQARDAPRRRSLNEIAANGGGRHLPQRAPRHWGGEADPALDDQIPF